ncbi:MAG: isopentenyl-diphosphate Delta-isomerase [Gemmatimonadota bacterium]
MTVPEEQVVLVTPDDLPIGVAGKASAHEGGMLHRAFSVFVVNGAGEWLLQRRASHKYHSGGLWSNTCCSHPRPGEAVEAAAHRRLREEMGFDCALDPVFSFVYRAPLDHGMIEHELDHVLIGVHDGDPVPDPREVGDWRRASPEEIRRALAERPKAFTQWFALAFERVERAVRAGMGVASVA